jgi:hypothetical protein
MVDPLVLDVYILVLFMQRVLKGVGTFSMEDKVRMLEFLAFMSEPPSIRWHSEYRLER